MKNPERSRGRRLVRTLPDDVVIEILSRVPANDILRFRRVCQGWRALFSSHHFVEMHMKAYSSPMILVLPKKKFKRNIRHELLLLDKWELPRKRLTIRKVPLDFITVSSYLLNLSYDGLIVVNCRDPSQRSSKLIIFNPIFRYQVTVNSNQTPGIADPSQFNDPGIADPGFDICGMFFNSLIKECCILLASFGRGPNIQFKMLNLGAQPCCRGLKQPAQITHKPRYPGREPLVVIDDATLYWMVGHSYLNHPINQFCGHSSCEELIMAFDIKTEEFTLMPHPGPTDGCNHLRHLNMNILKKDGLLSFVQNTITTTSATISIWTLKDSATRLWIKSHSVSVDMCHFRNYNFRVMAIGNEELLLKDSYARIYVCHLELGTVRWIRRTYNNRSISTYMPSFVSLRNCKSEIWI